MSKHIDNLISFEYEDGNGYSEEVFAFRIARQMTNEEVLREYQDLNLSGNLAASLWDHISCRDHEEFYGDNVAALLMSFNGEPGCSYLGISELLEQAAAGEVMWPEGTWFVGSVYNV